MRVFITGATSILGRVLCGHLQERGHHVIGLARNDASRALLHAMKVTVFSGHGKDVDRLADALVSVHGIVHLASTIPNSDAATEDDWPYSAEVVSGMMKRLIIASEQSGVRTMVFPSTYGVYGKTEGLEWVTEGTRVHADRNSQPFIDAEQALNLSSTRRKSTGVVLRMGIVYHHDSPSTKGLLYALKNGHAETIGDGAMYWPLIHAEDAVQAIRLALEEGPRGEVFNVADNEPVTQHTLYTTLAELIGAPLPRRGTGEINHYLRGGNPADLYRSVRLSNEKLRDRLGFEASYPTFRTGFRAVAEKLNYVEESQA